MNRKQEWLNKLKSRHTGLCVLAVLLLLLIYTVVCYNVIDKHATEPEREAAGDNLEALPVAEKQSSILPIPESDACVEWECGTYYSGISKYNIDTYLMKLTKAGWKNLQGGEILPDAVVGTVGYDLRKGDRILQLITFLNDSNYAGCNSILVYNNKDFSYEERISRVGAMQKKEALPLIQTQAEEMAKTGTISDAKKDVIGLFEIPIKNAFERLQVQAFAAFSDMGFTGCFLLRRGVASYVPGNLSDAMIADIDHDGMDELIDAYRSWKTDAYCLELVAYQYVNPDYFSSLTEILLVKYHICYVPERVQDEFGLEEDEKGRIILTGEEGAYGILSVDKDKILVQGEGAAELISWASAFDQSNLKNIREVDPIETPKPFILLNGKNLEYITQKWEEENQEYTNYRILKLIGEEQIKIPSVYLDSYGENEDSHKISINFGAYMPDSIQVFDAMIEESGAIRYQLTTERAVQIMDHSRVEFMLPQHMAYYLSSNSKDYERDWKRLFSVVCSWGGKQCTYYFVVNTESKSIFNEPEGDMREASSEGKDSKDLVSPFIWNLYFLSD